MWRKDTYPLDGSVASSSTVPSPHTVQPADGPLHLGHCRDIRRAALYANALCDNVTNLTVAVEPASVRVTVRYDTAEVDPVAAGSTLTAVLATDLGVVLELSLSRSSQRQSRKFPRSLHLCRRRRHRRRRRRTTSAAPTATGAGAGPASSRRRARDAAPRKCAQDGHELPPASAVAKGLGDQAAL